MRSRRYSFLFKDLLSLEMLSVMLSLLITAESQAPTEAARAHSPRQSAAASPGEIPSDSPPGAPGDVDDTPVHRGPSDDLRGFRSRLSTCDRAALGNLMAFWSTACWWAWPRTASP